MPEINSDIESRIRRALKSIPTGVRPNYIALSKEYRVPYQRLLARSKGRPNLYNRSSYTLKLTTTQNLALIVYLQRLDDLRIAPRTNQVVSTTNSILRIDHIAKKVPGPPPTVGTR